MQAQISYWRSNVRSTGRACLISSTGCSYQVYFIPHHLGGAATFILSSELCQPPFTSQTLPPVQTGWSGGALMITSLSLQVQWSTNTLAFGSHFTKYHSPD
ncbi:hypothetical protein SERLADRAFT_467317 [Serpula lacrymans var. lacrymans S7.9]|uniref:Uncharacterized protein n=1 Tax=Serpula lacrymans var. lacrymans (strain S7.9) TaxID=578457 RepID=F8NW20_SERL9|nr:uncharacterized protein SERLADRAFT_467317 [Serpula lacrymans var. lacrymans S7.9]EGO24277.1 hypothetical protein SERLADRAFT_467317 [Serpula lacrymans var. lacrymans S7.9]